MTKAKSSKPTALAVADDNKPAKKPRVRNDIKGTGQGWRKGVTKFTADEIDIKCEAYFQACQEADRKPTFEGLARHIGVVSDTLMIWLNADKEDSGEVYNPDVSLTLKKARDYLADDLQQRQDGMSVFRLKQPKYGGFIDRPDMGSGGAVTVNFSFVTSDGKITAGLTK